MSHYFSPDADASASEVKERHVTLRGTGFDVLTDKGVFSGNRVDPGTKVLLELVPEPPSGGTALDIGCGWGPLTMALADERPGLRVIGVDANPRAVDLTNQNLQRNRLSNARAYLVEDFLAAEPDFTCDVIWSNPPIRVGKAVLHEIMRTWLPRLSEDGVAYLVANKNLGGDSLHKWIASELAFVVKRIGSRQGFRVLEVRRP